jgi:SNF2 family DNA or RNA helicase
MVFHLKQYFLTMLRVGKYRVRCFHGNSKSQREAELTTILEKGGICLTTYGMVTANLPLLTDEVKWDYVILDEGHKIKVISIFPIHSIFRTLLPKLQKL